MKISKTKLALMLLTLFCVKNIDRQNINEENIYDGVEFNMPKVKTFLRRV